MVSGTDAVDSACKIARKWGIAKRGIDPQDLLILGVAGCYHGLSTSMWSLQNPGPARAGMWVHPQKTNLFYTLLFPYNFFFA